MDLLELLEGMPGGMQPEDPATDSATSLDFDKVEVLSDSFPSTSVEVEVSYREAIIDYPTRERIGRPFYEPFEILTMSMNEMAAEKLRTLAQRLRPTDLADLAVILTSATTTDGHIARLAQHKFELVAKGAANRIEPIERNLKDMADTYDGVVPALFPDAPSYREP